MTNCILRETRDTILEVLDERMSDAKENIYKRDVFLQSGESMPKILMEVFEEEIETIREIEGAISGLRKVDVCEE